MTETQFQADTAPLAPGTTAAAGRGSAGTSVGASRARSVLRHLLLVAASFVMLYPLLWLVVSSFRPTEVIFRTPGLWLNGLVLDNYTQGWFALGQPFGHYIINSSILVVGAVGGGVSA